MRNLFYLLFGLVALLLPSCGPREEVGHYPTGEVRYRAPRNRQGVVDGEVKYFYKNGTVERVEPYRQSQMHGLVKEYYPSGKLEYTEFFQNGVTAGPVKYFYPTGQLKNVSTKYGSTLRDTTRSYHPNGELSQMILYDSTGRRVDFGVWQANGNIDPSYSRPFFLVDRDTVLEGQDYTFEMVLGNRRSNVVNVKVLQPRTGIDSTKGVYSRSRFILRRPAPGQHTVTAQAINYWARKGSDTIWVVPYKPISKSFWVLPARSTQ